MCHQSVGLISRLVEAAGISTLCMSSALDISRSVNPPRTAFLDYPLGHTTGKPGEPVLQREIMLQALAAFTALAEPGSVQMLPFKWSEDDNWQQTAMRGTGDQRLPRLDAPQYQSDEDRLRAEAAACTSCQPPAS